MMQTFRCLKATLHSPKGLMALIMNGQDNECFRCCLLCGRSRSPWPPGPIFTFTCASAEPRPFLLQAFDQTNASSTRQLEDRWAAELSAVASDLETRISSKAAWQDLQSTALRLDEAIDGVGGLQQAVEALERDARGREEGCTKEEARRVAKELLRKWEAERDPTAMQASVESEAMQR